MLKVIVAFDGPFVNFIEPTAGVNVPLASKVIVSTPPKERESILISRPNDDNGLVSLVVPFVDVAFMVYV